MAINLSINVGAKGNFGSLARALNQLGANVTASQREIAAAAGQTQKQMSGVADTSRMAAQASGVFRTEMVRIKDPMDQLATSIRKNDVNFRSWRQSMRDSGQIAAKNNALMQSSVHNIQRQADGTMSATLAMRDWKTTAVSMGNQLGVMSAATRAFSNNMINVGKNLQWGGRQVTVGLSVPIMFAAYAANKAAMEIEGELVRLEKVYTTTTDNAAMELNELRVEMFNLADASAEAFGATASETLQIGAEFAAMGYTVASGLEGMIVQAQRVQQLGETDLPDAINLVRSVQASWKLETEELTETINRLNAIENQTPLGLKDIATAMPEVAAVAEDLGVSVTYAAGAMAAMREGGLDAGEAAMALRQLLIRITDPTDVARERFASLGIDLNKVFEGAEDGEEKVRRLAAALGSIDAEARVGALSKLVDVRQAARVGILVDAINEATAGAENAWSRSMDVMGMSTEELADDAAREMQRWRESAVGQAQILNARIQNEMAQIGQPLMRVFNAVRGLVADILGWFNQLSSGAKGTILVMLGFAAVMGPMVMLLGVLTNAVFTLIRAGAAMGTFATKTRLMTREERVLNAVMKENAVVAEYAEQALMELERQTHENTQAGNAFALSLERQQQALIEGAEAARAADRGMTPRRRPERREPRQLTRRQAGASIVGGGMAIAGVTSMLSMLVSTEGPLGKLLNTITSISLVAAAIGPALMALLPATLPLLPVLGAVAAAAMVIAGGLWLWKRRANELAEANQSAATSAEKLAESAGLAYGEIGDVINEEGVANLQTFAQTNEHVINKLKEMEGRAAREAYLFTIAYEMRRHGVSDEDIKAQVARLASEAEVDIRLGVILDVDTHNINNQVTEILSQMQEGQEDRWWDMGLDNFQSSIDKILRRTAHASGELSRTTVAAIDDIGRAAGEALRAGDYEQYYAAASAAEEEWERRLNSRVEGEKMTLEEVRQARRRLAEQIIKHGNLQNIEAKNVHRLSQLQDHLASGYAGVAVAIEKVASAQIHLERIREMRAGGVTFLGPMGDLARAEIDAIKDLRAANKSLDSANKDVAASAEEGAAGLEEYGGAAETAADRAGRLSSEIRSQVSSVQDLVADLAMEQIEARHDAVMDSWDARIDKVKDAQELEREELDKTHEQDIKNSEASYDLRINGLKDTIEEEEALDRVREFAFARERRRRDWLQNRAQGGIDVRAAIARGDLDEAARIQQQLASEESDYRMNEVEETRKFEEEQRRKGVNFQIDKLEEAKKAETDRLKTEQDLAKERLKTEQDLQNKRLDAQKDAVRRSNEMEKRRAEFQIGMWRDTVASSEEEYVAHLGTMEGILNDFGINSMEPIAQNYSRIVNDNIYGGFSTAYDRAEASLREQDKWNAAAIVMREAVEAGITGEALPASPGTNPAMLTRRHSGGIIPSRSPQRGLAQGEVPAVLQSGEYVVQRKAVQNLGVDFLEQLNRYHGGGLIDTLDRWAPAQAVSYTLGQVLSGRELTESGSLGMAINERLGNIGLAPGPEGGEFERSGRWPRRQQGVLSSNTRAAQNFVRGNWELPHGVAAALGRADSNSDHHWGKALDIMVSRLGQMPDPQQRMKGWQIANWFIKNPEAFGTKYVIWDKKINSGSGWRNYGRYGDDPGPTKGHYDHVHLSVLHKGGLAGKDGVGMSIPALRKGASVNYDNVVANLHRGETVLTSPLTDKLKEGIGQLANGGGNEYNVTIEINGSVTPDNTNALARQIRREIETMENRRGPNRRIG